MSDSEDQAGVPLIEPISDSDSPAPAKSKSNKRKRETEDDAEAKKAARKARRKAKKPQDIDDSTLDAEKGINTAIAQMDSRLMADHLAQRTKRFQPDLSLVEAEDWRLSESSIADSTSFDKDRVTENLPEFLEHFAVKKSGKKGSKGDGVSWSPKEKGSPHTLVVTGAGLRAADLTRALRKFQTKDAKVAKLFAKHIKMEEAVQQLKKDRINIGVGTPQRIMDLLDDGALSAIKLDRIVVDASHIDQKKRGVLDMKELQIPLVNLLTRKEFKERYGSGDGKIELLFY
ncbi:hypotheticalsprotein [Cercospora beticola]|uniref:Hypotheticalsprotein n=1 Tax=Cercospora beticola TaxID=122368 RepID=A0A2G5I076_CERBT|nr:hypotheticalsprotein [Cercospora beticola]PIA98161.1 hypotheticalsprotein [Cercospora beticola]WPA98039.1 hypothetical protein RHO25_002650 [Cercospora beticola]CAK1359250.1 unnamed protein product [Cercospora beticola]